MYMYMYIIHVNMYSAYTHVQYMCTCYACVSISISTCMYTVSTFTHDAAVLLTPHRGCGLPTESSGDLH